MIDPQRGPDLPSREPCEPDLRIYAPPDDGVQKPSERRPKRKAKTARGPSLDWTLTQLYREHVLPKCREAGQPNRRPASPKTIEQDWIALRHWQRITGDPPLRRILDDLSAEFVARIMAESGPMGVPLGQNAARKTCLHLQFMLNQAGPPNRRHPRALALFSDRKRWPVGLPVLPAPPAKEPDDERFFTLDQIAHLIDVARAKGPTLSNFLGVRGSVYWPNLILWTYNTGLRPETSMLARRTMIAARCPEDFIRIPAEIFKRHQQRPPFCINRWAREAVEAVRIEGSDGLFPWGVHSRSGEQRPWPAGHSRLFEAFREIADKAGLPADQHLAFSGFRKALLTWLAEHHPLLASIVAGHRGKSVVANHYTHYTAVRSALAQVPQPGRHVQKNLF